MNQTPTPQNPQKNQLNKLLSVALIIYLIALGFVLFLNLVLPLVYQAPFWNDSVSTAFFGLLLLTATDSLVENQN